MKFSENKEKIEGKKRMEMGRRAKLSELNQIRVPDVSNQHTLISMERHYIRNVLQLLARWGWFLSS